MKVSEIEEIVGRSIFDSRGNPTTEVDIRMGGEVYRASCPSGASTGSQEALELRDGNKDVCGGKGVDRAVAGIGEISREIKRIGELSIEEQRKIDEFLCQLDGTENKGRLGANAILPVSMAMCRAAAGLRRERLCEYIRLLCGGKEIRAPKLFFNVINGGSHAGNSLFLQEVMVSFGGGLRQSLDASCVFHAALKKTVGEKYGSTGIGDEGGFAPQVGSLEEALDLIVEAGSLSKCAPEIALDVAATEFFDGRYNLGWKCGGERYKSGEEMIEYYREIIRRYPSIKSIEDPFAEKDYRSWAAFFPVAQELGVRVVGDDLTVTNKTLIQKAGEEKLCDVALIKMNQVGSISETIDAVAEARKQGMKVMASHRSGETEDVFLSHLAAGIAADFMKSGALCRSERVSKYNELLRIFGE
jgi:enolase